MKHFIKTLLLIGVSHVALAQTDTTTLVHPHKFKHNLQAGFTLNQSAFSDNFKGGGQSSFAYGWYLNYLAKHQSENWDFNSDLQMQLGFQNNQGQERRKTSDRLFYDVKMGYILAPKWNIFGSVNFLSVFAKGYDSKLKSADLVNDSFISKFMAPAYITSSVGLEYKPLDYIWARLGVGTLRQTIVLDPTISQAQLYGLEKPGDKLRNQLVMQFIFNFDKDLAKNVNFKLRYTMNYDYFKNGQPNAFVYILNTNLTLRATKYISSNIQVNIFKDYDMDHDMQWSQIFSLGMVYSFNRE